MVRKDSKVTYIAALILILNSYYENTSSVVGSEPVYHATDPQFDSGLRTGHVSPNFHSFGAHKINN